MCTRPPGRSPERDPLVAPSRSNSDTSHVDADTQRRVAEAFVTGHEEGIWIVDRFGSCEVNGVVSSKIALLGELTGPARQCSGDLNDAQLRHQPVEVSDGRPKLAGCQPTQSPIR